MPSSLRLRLVVATTASALAVGTLVAVFGLPGRSTPAAAASCAPGFTAVRQVLAEIRQEMRGEHAGDPGEDREFVAEARRELPMLNGVDADTRTRSGSAPSSRKISHACP